jgi:soluble lytic murein transglycosylase-like protein
VLAKEVWIQKCGVVADCDDVALAALLAILLTACSRPAYAQSPEPVRLDLPGIHRLFEALSRQRASINEGERAAAWADISILTDSIVGEQSKVRDTAAYQLLALGYSARETADIVSGHITKHALDTAHKMLLIGRGREAAADYLDREYARLRPAVPPASLPATTPPLPSRFEVTIVKYASLHGLDPALIRAVIAAESAFDERARSRAGAIGLMQLMPATARALGVDPWIPEQNIEGGARYLSALVTTFGGIELALVAYNGGPGFALRYARGQTPLYGETREYVRRVLAGR